MSPPALRPTPRLRLCATPFSLYHIRKSKLVDVEAAGVEAGVRDWLDKRGDGGGEGEEDEGTDGFEEEEEEDDSEDTENSEDDSEDDE